MAGICLDNKETITDRNYTDKYSGNSCLPNGGTGFTGTSDVDAKTGLVRESAIQAQISNLLTSMNAIAPGTITEEKIQPAADFSSKSAVLRSAIDTEYCFYYKRYMFILKDVLMTAATSDNSITTDSLYLKKKANAETINMKLNQILQVMQGLVNSRLGSLKTYYGGSTGVNKMNSQLDDTRSKLLIHTEMLKNVNMEKDVRSSMIDYSLEKNSSSRNLLGIYGFMNIVAVGLLFYLYRISKS
jgi:hypothetical protein